LLHGYQIFEFLQPFQRTRFLLIQTRGFLLTFWRQDMNTQVACASLRLLVGFSLSVKLLASDSFSSPARVAVTINENINLPGRSFTTEKHSYVATGRVLASR
jgi:hypothetical protein